jgi:FkbM family methyltransferase
MNYNWCFPYIKRGDIKLIYEIGARDCLDSISLAKEFNCPVIAFECNPDSIKECKNTLSSNNQAITLIEKAVHEENKIVSFRPFNRSKYDNIGASSLFEIDFVSSRQITDPDYGRKDVQDIIEVEAIRLDKFIDEAGAKPDLICMDIQEAELITLKGLGEYIKDIKYIVFEGSNVNTYKGGCTFMDVHNYLISKNYRFVRTSLGHVEIPDTYTYTFCDFLYINNLTC